MCQWLPLYELSTEDVKSVIRTFSRSFRYTMVWLTQYDAELIGSNSPIVVDEQELERRIAQPAVFHDLDRVMMGSATDFLSYFLMASAGMRAFSTDGAQSRERRASAMRWNAMALSRCTGKAVCRSQISQQVVKQPFAEVMDAPAQPPPTARSGIISGRDAGLPINKHEQLRASGRRRAWLGSRLPHCANSFRAG